MWPGIVLWPASALLFVQNINSVAEQSQRRREEGGGGRGEDERTRRERDRSIKSNSCSF